MITQQLTLETSRLMTQGGKVVDKYDAKGNLIETGVPSGLTKGYARKLHERNYIVNLITFLVISDHLNLQTYNLVKNVEK